MALRPRLGQWQWAAQSTPRAHWRVDQGDQAMAARRLREADKGRAQPRVRPEAKAHSHPR
eukprot:9468688-Pyramimonas_sp.AAC.1